MATAKKAAPQKKSPVVQARTAPEGWLGVAIPKYSPVKIPAASGAAVDLLYEMRAARQAAQRFVDAAQADETRLKEHLLQKFGKDKLDGVTGRLANLSIDSELVGSVKNWDKFWAHLFKTRDTNLLQRRLNDGYYRELREAKKRVPGVEDFKKTKFSLTKAAGKKGGGE